MEYAPHLPFALTMRVPATRSLQIFKEQTKRIETLVRQGEEHCEDESLIETFEIRNSLTAISELVEHWTPEDKQPIIREQIRRIQRKL